MTAHQFDFEDLDILRALSGEILSFSNPDSFESRGIKVHFIASFADEDLIAVLKDRLAWYEAGCPDPKARAQSLFASVNGAVE